MSGDQGEDVEVIDVEGEDEVCIMERSMCDDDNGIRVPQRSKLVTGLNDI